MITFIASNKIAPWMLFLFFTYDIWSEFTILSKTYVKIGLNEGSLLVFKNDSIFKAFI